MLCTRATAGLRGVHTSAARLSVKLAYEHFSPTAPRRVAPDTSSLVICHGLLCVAADSGSKQNWRSLARAMARDFGVPVYTVDLRNHGESPHSASMAYADLADDVKRFLDDHGLENTALIGHSLGGKVVMSVVLDPALEPGRVSRMVSVDMTPAEGRVSRDFFRYTERMIEIEDARCTSRTEADEMLQTVEKDPAVRMFLLTNLVRTDDGSTLRFRNPLKQMLPALEGIGEFPYAVGDESTPPERTWPGPALLVRGENSKCVAADRFVNPRTIVAAERFFPNLDIVAMQTGHWCQAEQPGQFKGHIRAFLNK